MATISKPAGRRMRKTRKEKGLTMRDVHNLSRQIAKSLGNRDYVVSPSRLSDIERKGQTPNLYRLHALSLAYGLSMRKVLQFYGID